MVLEMVLLGARWDVQEDPRIQCHLLMKQLLTGVTNQNRTGARSCIQYMGPFTTFLRFARVYKIGVLVRTSIQCPLQWLSTGQPI